MRKLSISSNNNINDLTNMGNETICLHCNKCLNMNDLAQSTTITKNLKFKNSFRLSLHQKRNRNKQELVQTNDESLNTSDLEQADKKEEDKTNSNSDTEQQSDFTTSILAGTQANSPNKTNDSRLFKNEDTESLSETTSDKNKEASNARTSSYQNQPFKCLANSIDPKYLLTVIKERLESHKTVDINATTMGNNTTSNVTNCNTNNSNSTVNNSATNSNINNSNSSSRAKCIPSARVINCQHHCVAILATRLFAILCNEKSFQKRLMNENQEACFNLINEILYPNNDPVNI